MTIGSNDSFVNINPPPSHPTHILGSNKTSNQKCNRIFKEEFDYSSYILLKLLSKNQKESSDNKLVKNSRNEATLLTFIKQSTYVTSPLSSTISKCHIRIYISATPSTADDTSWGKINYRNFLLHDVYFARRASEIHMKP